MNYDEVICNLNHEIFEKFGEIEKQFTCSTNGYVTTISFDGALLWNGDFDEREWIEEKNDYEPLELYIKKKFNEYVDQLQKLKFLI